MTNITSAFPSLTSENTTTTRILMTIICVLSYISYAILYILYIVPLIKRKHLNYLSSTNLQLILACTLNTISFTLPSNSTEINYVCYVQAFMNTFSDLSKTGILTVCTIGSYLSCTIPDKLDKNFKFYIMITTLIIWIPPFLFSIIGLFAGGIGHELNYCWINGDALLYSYLGYSILYYIIFYVYFIKLACQIKALVKHAKGMKDKIKGYKIRLIINGVIGTFIFITLCLNTSFSIYSDIVKEDNNDSQPNTNLDSFFSVTYLMEGFSSMILALGFGLNNEKISEINNIFCCQGENRLEEESSEFECLEIEYPI